MSDKYAEFLTWSQQWYDKFDAELYEKFNLKRIVVHLIIECDLCVEANYNFYDSYRNVLTNLTEGDVSPIYFAPNVESSINNTTCLLNKEIVLHVFDTTTTPTSLEVVYKSGKVVCLHDTSSVQSWNPHSNDPILYILVK